MATPAVVATGIAMFTSMLEPVIPVLGELGVAQDKQNAITSALTSLQQASQAFAIADAGAPQGDLITRVETDAEGVLTALAALPLPLFLSMGVRCAQAVLPGILAIAKMVFPSRAATASIEATTTAP